MQGVIWDWLHRNNLYFSFPFSFPTFTILILSKEKQIQMSLLVGTRVGEKPFLNLIQVVNSIEIPTNYSVSHSSFTTVELCVSAMWSQHRNATMLQDGLEPLDKLGGKRSLWLKTSTCNPHSHWLKTSTTQSSLLQAKLQYLKFSLPLARNQHR